MCVCAYCYNNKYDVILYYAIVWCVGNRKERKYSFETINKTYAYEMSEKTAFMILLFLCPCLYESCYYSYFYSPNLCWYSISKLYNGVNGIEVGTECTGVGRDLPTQCINIGTYKNEIHIVFFCVYRQDCVGVYVLSHSATSYSTISNINIKNYSCTLLCSFVDLRNTRVLTSNKQNSII